MITKINLIIKVQSNNILITKTPQNDKWQFPYIFNDNTKHNFIPLILKTTTDCGIEDVKSINHLFEDQYKPHENSIYIPIVYYEILIKKHKNLAPSIFYSILRYFSMPYLKNLTNITFDITKYLNYITI